jgi:hypothetical protein
MVKHMVYGIRAGSLLKIGVTSSIKHRMATLQNGSGVTITLVVLWEFRDRGMARAAEKHLHKTFAEHRRRGEWFEVRADEVNREMVKSGHLFLAQSAPDARRSAEPQRAVSEGPPMMKATRNTRKYLADRARGDTLTEFRALQAEHDKHGLSKSQAVRLAYLSRGRTRTFECCADGRYREHGLGRDGKTTPR